MSAIMNALHNPGLSGLVCNVFAVWVVLALSIVVLSATGSDFGGDGSGGPRDAPWTPPGALIGGVWALLYTLMAAALWLINCTIDRTPYFVADTLRVPIVALIGFCLVWPFYAFDTQSRWPGLIGNTGIFCLSLIAIWQLWPYARAAAFMIVPVTIWIVVASATILDGARRYGW